jgi:hypothetical protein
LIETHLRELLYETLETELGNVDVYKTALLCAVDTDLKAEWQKYLHETENHVQVVLRIFDNLKLDPDEETAGRHVVRHIGESLVEAMELSLSAGNAEASQRVAAERIVEAETKDQLNWELLSRLAEHINGTEGRIIQEAAAEIENEKNSHLYHGARCARQLWSEFLEMPAPLPTPDEVEKKFKTAVGSGRLKNKVQPLIN